MPRRPELTDKGLLAESYGERPYTVTLREEKERGTNVLLDYTVGAGRRRKRTLGYPVRTKEGRRWVWDEDALERAREAALDRSAELRLARLREDVLEARTLTFGEAVQMFTDPKEGGLPRSKAARRDYRRYLGNLKEHLGGSTPWNAIRPAQVLARARELEAEGSIPSALKEVAVLRTLHRWLRDQEGVKGLEDPARNFPWKEMKKRHTVSRPRYTDEEVQALVKVRHRVDPRFSLLLALMDDSGARLKALRASWRSRVDMRLDREPSPEAAPYGWMVLPALKGQAAPMVLLTAFQRRELESAFDGYLRELERRWQEEGEDYPLFPGARLGDKTEKVVSPTQPGAYRAVSPRWANLWLHEAEELAGVEHVEGRAYHGIRRSVSDLMYDEIGLDAMTAAMGWSSRDTPERIYVDQRRLPDRMKAREAMERKRREEAEDVDEP